MNNQLLCNDCGWIGKEEDCAKRHSKWDIEIFGLAYLQCPKCGSDNLIELQGRRAKVLTPV